MKTSTSRPGPKLPVLGRLIRDMSNERYHGMPGTWSSSQLKDIIDDEEVFIKKYIHKSIPRQDSEAMDTGTYFHTAVLEPHKVKSEIAVFGGKVRRGREWEEFKSKSVGKTVITAAQQEQADRMAAAVKASPVCMEYLEGSVELSLFVRLNVHQGKIIAPDFGKVLTPDGWISASGEVKKPQGFEAIFKVRADCLGDNFVSDLKSTRGKATQASSVRDAISKYKYDLSAALYLDLFSLVRESVSAFIWVFASKENACARAWEASRDQIRIGRAKWSWALTRMADLHASDWEIPDYLGTAHPLPHEMEWLVTKETDLL